MLIRAVNQAGSPLFSLWVGFVTLIKAAMEAESGSWRSDATLFHAHFLLLLLLLDFQHLHRSSSSCSNTPLVAPTEPEAHIWSRVLLLVPSSAAHGWCRVDGQKPGCVCASVCMSELQPQLDAAALCHHHHHHQRCSETTHFLSGQSLLVLSHLPQISVFRKTADISSRNPAQPPPPHPQTQSKQKDQAAGF